MPKFVMKEKLFAFGDDYVVRDEHGAERYFVDGRAFSIGDKLSFQDMQKRELAFIRQRLLHWGPTYEILRDGKVAAVVKKKLFTFFHCEFTVDVPGPDDLLAEGNFWDHEYEFRRGSRVAARVSKAWFSFTDSYGIDVERGEDEILVIASAVVIDQCCHEKKR